MVPLREPSTSSWISFVSIWSTFSFRHCSAMLSRMWMSHKNWLASGKLERSAETRTASESEPNACNKTIVRKNSVTANYAN